MCIAVLAVVSVPLCLELSVSAVQMRVSRGCDAAAFTGTSLPSLPLRVTPDDPETLVEHSAFGFRFSGARRGGEGAHQAGASDRGEILRPFAPHRRAIASDPRTGRMGRGLNDGERRRSTVPPLRCAGWRVHFTGRVARGFPAVRTQQDIVQTTWDLSHNVEGAMIVAGHRRALWRHQVYHDPR